jgi:DNA-binding transcriptional ArsR family regulator
MFMWRLQEDSTDTKQIHDVLRNDRRRLALQYLKQRLEPVEVSELSEHIAELEVDESPPPRSSIQSVYNSLSQTHLPKLENLGFVEFDRDRNLVSLRETAREIDVYMNVITPLGITWESYYRILGVVGLVAVVAADTDLGFLAGVDSLPFATAFLFAFVLSISYQLWSLRWFYLQLLTSDG